MAENVAIGDRKVGAGQPCFVIAEVGVNHNGDLELARRLIDVAADAGADAVKFQTFDPATLVAEDAPMADYQKIGTSERSQADMLRALALEEDDFRELEEHARSAGIVFMSSPFDESAVAMLDKLGVPAFKIPSGEATNHSLLRCVAKTGKPLIMSTGMCTLDEVRAAVDALGANATERLILLHCVSNYPAAMADCNLRAMDLMREAFSVPVGWSDHTLGATATIAAVALGACVIEKHITLDKNMPGPDHRASMEPAELVELVEAIRATEAALGERRKQPTAAEMEVAAVARKSLHWRRELPVGHVVEDGDLVALRPGTGLSPIRLPELLGRALKASCHAGAMAEEEDFD